MVGYRHWLIIFQGRSQWLMITLKRWSKKNRLLVLKCYTDDEYVNGSVTDNGYVEGSVTDNDLLYYSMVT